MKVAVTLNIDDDKIHADFTGSAPQGSGGTNGTQGVAEAPAEFQSAQSMRKYHIMMVVCGTLPVTSEGTIVKAKYPAATAMATLCPAGQEQEAVESIGPVAQNVLRLIWPLSLYTYYFWR